VATRFAMPGCAALNHSEGPVGWLQYIAASGDKRQKRRNVGILCTFSWMVWKERNRRIFEHVELPPNNLATLIHDSIVMQ
jgi:hypothetical protein